MFIYLFLFLFIYLFIYFYFILLYNTVLVSPYIDMNPPRVYMWPQTCTPLPLLSPQHPSGSSPCTSPKHAVSCIRHRLVIRFLHDSIHVSRPYLSYVFWIQIFNYIFVASSGISQRLFKHCSHFSYIYPGPKTVSLPVCYITEYVNYHHKGCSSQKLTPSNPSEILFVFILKTHFKCTHFIFILCHHWVTSFL